MGGGIARQGLLDTVAVCVICMHAQTGCREMEFSIGRVMAAAGDQFIRRKSIQIYRWRAGALEYVAWHTASSPARSARIRRPRTHKSGGAGGTRRPYTWTRSHPITVPLRAPLRVATSIRFARRWTPGAIQSVVGACRARSRRRLPWLGAYSRGRWGRH